MLLDLSLTHTDEVKKTTRQERRRLLAVIRDTVGIIVVTLAPVCCDGTLEPIIEVCPCGDCVCGCSYGDGDGICGPDGSIRRVADGDGDFDTSLDASNHAAGDSAAIVDADTWFDEDADLDDDAFP